MAEKEKNKGSRYYDPTGELTNKNLALGSWYVRNKVLLRKIGVGILISWIAIGGVYSLYHWGEYLFSGYWKERDNRIANVQQFQNYTNLQPAYGAQNLQINDMRVSEVSGKFDFFAQAFNPNKKFLARVSYKFAFDGGETALRSVVIMPGKKIPLGLYGFESGVYPSGVRLVVENTDWQKIDAHVIPDIEAYINPRLDFQVENLNFERQSMTEGIPPRITFDIINQSAYSYYEGRFAVLMISGSGVENILPLSLKNFRSGDVFPIDLRPPFDISGVSDIELVPLMNVFDPNEFLSVLK